MLAAFFAAAYVVRRAKLGDIALRGLLIGTALALTIVMVVKAWWTGLVPWDAIVVICCVLAVLGLLAAETRRYVVFRKRSHPLPPGTQSLHAEEKLRLHGSGPFSVNEMQRYLVEVPTFFWSTRLGDYILAAQVQPVRALGIGVPRAESGWWYLFLDPGRIASVEAGELAFGLRRRPAVRIKYRSAKTSETVFLSCTDAQQLETLLRALRPNELGQGKSYSAA